MRAFTAFRLCEGSTVDFQNLLESVDLQVLTGNKPMKPGVLRLEVLQPRRFGDFQPRVLLLPPEERRLGYPVLPAALCPPCGGTMVFAAVIEDPVKLKAITEWAAQQQPREPKVRGPSIPQA